MDRSFYPVNEQPTEGMAAMSAGI